MAKLAAAQSPASLSHTHGLSADGSPSLQPSTSAVKSRLASFHFGGIGTRRHSPPAIASAGCGAIDHRHASMS